MSKKTTSWRKSNLKNRYEVDEKFRKRLEKLADIPWSQAERRDENKKYTTDPEQTMYVKKYYRTSLSPYLKKLAARKTRRYKGEIANGNQYRRLFDFWWEYD